MAKIIYAVQGEGFGHSTRSGIVLEHLVKKHEVQITANNKSYKYLVSKFPNVHNIETPGLAHYRGSIKIGKTFTNFFKDLPDYYSSWGRFERLVDKFKPNLIISDFEPIAFWMARHKKLPIISIDNMNVAVKCKIRIPEEYKSAYQLFAQGIIKFFSPWANYYFIYSYIFPEAKKPQKIFLFYPIIRTEILAKKPTSRNHILVYQTYYSYDKLIDVLSKIKGEKFILYGTEHQGKIDNMEFRPFSQTEFINDLASSKAIITNGGFSLISEALYLKKPILSVPVRKQFEQVYNALALEELDYGKMSKDLNVKDLNSFLDNLKHYNQKLSSYKPDSPQKLFSRLDKVIKKMVK